ncbi:MAG TPA: hypothetical protein VK420_13090 [Longimicrobium sp.]|nr:hypothetical protein [Longimicrobium sp.]
MRHFCIAAAALFVLGCNGRPVLTDTAAMDELGRFRIGMHRAEARRIARERVPRAEWISCKSHPGYELCSQLRLPVDSERGYKLIFQKDTLRALSWTRRGDFETLRRRYAHFGEPQRVRSGSPPRPRDILAEWVSADSMTIRGAICHDGRSRPVCKLTAAATTPAEIRRRAAQNPESP